jgi:hypothetical protein
MKSIDFIKKGFVETASGFEKRCLLILEPEMRQYVGPVLRQWRNLLFPQGFVLDEPAPNDTNSQDLMYEDMIAALEGALTVVEGGR